MRNPTALLICLFPILAPTLVFAHARPHPHPHADVVGRTAELHQVEKLKRQLPVLNDTAIPVETTSSSSESETSTSTTSTRQPNLDDILSSIESDVLGSDTTSTSESSSASTSDSSSTTTSESSSETTSDPTSSASPPGMTAQPQIPINTESSDDTTTTSRSQIPIIGSLSDIIETLLPDPTDTTTSAEPTTESSTEDITTTKAPTATPTGLDDILSSILSDVTSVVDPITTLPPNATETSTTLPDVTDPPTVTLPIDTTTDLPTDTATETTPTDTATETTPTDTATETTPTDTVTDTTPTDTGVIITTDSPTNTTTLPTDTITGTPPIDTSTSLTQTDSITDTTAALPAPTPAPVNSTSTAPTDTSLTSLPLETSESSGQGTATDTASDGPSQTAADGLASTTAAPSQDTSTSEFWFGTSLITQGSQTVGDVNNPTETAATTLPSGVPEAITPAGGVPDEPNNSTLIQIGFTKQYNYAFVSDSLKSAAQICDFLPTGLSYGLGVGMDELHMHTLQPLQSEGLDYIITLGLIYVPSDVFLKLQSDIHAPNSALFRNPDPSIRAFMNCIDPSIPLIPGQNIVFVPPGSGGSGGDPNDPSWIAYGDGVVDGSEATSTAGAGPEDGGDPYGSDGGSRNTITGKQVTIGVASVGAAALYGVAMYFLAKRYRNNRLSHRRSQSLSGGGIEPPPISDLRSSGALSPMMSTYFFNNGRATPTGSDKRGSKGSKTSATARGQISAPMMSENSLGWD